MGAFGEMRHTPSPASTTQKLRVDMSSSGSSPISKVETPILPSSSMSQHPPTAFPRGSQSYTSSRSIPHRIDMSNRSSTNSQRPLLPPPPQDRPVRFQANNGYLQKLSDVYSQSGDTVEFAKNLSDYVNEKIPYQISIAVLSCFSLLAFLLIIFGLLNAPFCAVQPMIPIWLIVEGVLFIISATFRIYFLIPTPRRTAYRRQQRQLGASLLCKGLEVLFALANVVWLILGCVWVYGSKAFVHFNEGMFERHYCDPMIYWSAFFACTAFLIFYCIIIFLVICLLIVGSVKENSSQDQNLD
ncbi:Protein CBG04286 [Caenorhabditis briggsae]|uniref:Protein CBG04286 n=1 Tax=Caenorhabditis briggsae TaxID=6238 RepID=A8WX56_CAEBR|nr:Protein CBG04286 [Caenorhabditis briggsae]CAP25027.2 Protein CBG04286 [Caenorhabditis briggsae]